MPTAVRDVRWPFFVLVAILFGLCLIAPGRWRRDGSPDGAAGPVLIASSAGHLLPMPGLPEVALETPVAVSPDASVASSDLPVAADVSIPVPAVAISPPVAPEPGEIVQVSDTGEPLIDIPSDVDIDVSAPPQPAVTADVSATWDEGLANAARHGDLPTPLATGVPAPVEAKSGWPMPADVIARLHALASHEPARQWAGELLCLLDDLRGAAAMTPVEFVAALDHLKRLLDTEALEARLGEAELASEVIRIRLALERRQEAWRSLHALAHAAVREQATTDRIASRDPEGLILARPAKQILADDATTLLHELEAYEAAPTATSGRTIVAAAARFSREHDLAARQLANHLTAHYRNANIRVAVHQDLANRFLPEPTTTGGRVNDFVAGVPVHGRQWTSTRVRLRFLPDERTIRLGLEAHGEVDSDTAAESGPATLFTRGETRFLARKLLVLDHRRWRVFPAAAAAQSNNELTGVKTDFDALPILNSLVHNIVRSKHDERRWQAQREVEQRVSGEARSRLDDEADVKLADMATRATEKFTEPMRRMGLEPTPIALATTDERITLRYRLAGGEQVGGHTPRPRAPGNTLLSVQLHESAINNALDNLQLSGQTYELRSLYEHVASRLGRPDIKVPEDVPENVRITFDAENPVHVRLADGRAEVTLRLARIKVEGKTWKNLKVVASYQPRASGLDAVFVRDQPISLAGENLTTRSSLVLRGAFTKMFTRNRQVHLLPATVRENAKLADLAVTQLVVHDGWAGLAIAPGRVAAGSAVAAPDAESATTGAKVVR